MPMQYCPGCGMKLNGDPLRGGTIVATYGGDTKPRRKRKLSAWNKYVKANSSKPSIKIRFT